MKTGLIILCRYSSTRLYGKILKKIEGKEVLQYICDKVKLINNIDDFCIATSIEKEDDAIEEFCNQRSLNVYRGSLENVSKRFYDCAQENKYDAIIRVNGDNIFLDPLMIEEAVDTFLKGNFDFLSNVKERTYPKGMSIEIVRKEMYGNALQTITNSAYYSEHVMPYFYDNEDNYKVNYLYHSDDFYKNVDLALDTSEDFKLAEKIIQSFTKPHDEYNSREIVELYKKIKSEKL